MNAQLPVPVSPHALRLPGADPNAVAAASGLSHHVRRPRMERVVCLDHCFGLLAAGGGRVCCIWNTATHTLHRRIVVDEPIHALWMTRDRRSIALASGCTVGLYDLATGALRFAFRHEAPVTSVHVGAAAPLLASADETGCILLHDLVSGDRIRELQFPPGRPIVFVHRSRYVLVESQTHCSLVEIDNPPTPRRFSYDADAVTAPEGPLLNTTLVAHAGHALRWFDCARYDSAYRTRVFGSAIRSMDICDDQNLVLGATADGGLHLFDLRSAEPRGKYESFTLPLTFARFGANASIYVAGGEALVMHLVEGRHVRSYYDEAAPLVAMAWHERHHALLVSNRDGGVTHVGLQDGRRRRPFSGHAGSVSVLVCNDDWVASGAYDGTLRIWRWDGTPVVTLNLDEGPVQAIVLVPESRTVWVGTWAGRASCFDVDTGTKLRALACCRSSIRALDIDASRRRLLAGGNDDEVVVLDLQADGAVLQRHRQPGTAYRAIFDADGDVWAAADDGVHRYGARDPQPHRVFRSDGVRWFDLFAGKLFALSLEGQLTVHDTARGELLQQTRLPGAGPFRSVVARSADRIVIASGEGFVRMLDARLEPVASLELLREGFLWCTPAVGGHPGWLHTDRPDLVDVGEPIEGGLRPWDEADPRRARHLAVWNSPSHVMQIVAGEVPKAGRIASALLGSTVLADMRHRLGHTPPHAGS